MYCTYFQSKGFFNRQKKGVLNHGGNEWFLFFEVKASKYLSTNIDYYKSKNIIKTEENQTPSSHWFTVFLVTKLSLRYLDTGSVLLRNYLPSAHHCTFTAASTNPSLLSN